MEREILLRKISVRSNHCVMTTVLFNTGTCTASLATRFMEMLSWLSDDRSSRPEQSSVYITKDVPWHDPQFSACSWKGLCYTLYQRSPYSGRLKTLGSLRHFTAQNCKYSFEETFSFRRYFAVHDAVVVQAKRNISAGEELLIDNGSNNAYTYSTMKSVLLMKY